MTNSIFGPLINIIMYDRVVPIKFGAGCKQDGIYIMYVGWSKLEAH